MFALSFSRHKVLVPRIAGQLSPTQAVTKKADEPVLKFEDPSAQWHEHDSVT